MTKMSFITGACIAWISLSLPGCQKQSSAPADAMTGAELLNRCAEAMGGWDIIDQIETFHVKAVYPDHGTIPMEIIIKRPNKSYNPGGEIVFDGRRICLLSGHDGNSDPVLAPEGDWKDGEVEIAYHFPAFFDHPSEYLGTADVDGKAGYKLKVDLPLGAEMTYMIDATTFLIMKVKFKFDMNGREIDDWRDWGDYREVEGYQYPHTFTYESRTGRQNGWIHSVEINVPVNDTLFQIPVDLGGE